MSRELNELIARRNALAGKDEEIELFDVMDAAESEEQAIEYLRAEIERFKKRS